MEKLKVYLATPYGFGKKKGLLASIVQWWRCKQVTKVASNWMETGYNVFSPITHTHPMSKYVDLTHAEWLEVDFQWIDACDELWVLCQPGWQSSDGVGKETKYAKSKGIPVKFLKRGGHSFYNYSVNEWF